MSKPILFLKRLLRRTPAQYILHRGRERNLQGKKPRGYFDDAGFEGNARQCIIELRTRLSPITVCRMHVAKFFERTFRVSTAVLLASTFLAQAQTPQRTLLPG